MKIIYRVVAVSLVMWMAKSITEEILGSMAHKKRNLAIDDMSAESFPSSDAPSSWAGAAE